MKHTVKICTFLGLAAFLASGCFVGSRNAEEPRTLGAAAPTAATRSNPTFLTEARVLYEGSTDNLPKDMPEAEREYYKQKLAALQADGYQSCVGCHQANGSGNKAINATNFTDAGWQRNNSTPGMVTSIVNGKGKIMPSYKSKLTQQQIYYLVEYIRKFEDTAQKDNSVIGGGVSSVSMPTPKPTPASTPSVTPTPVVAAAPTDTGLSSEEARLQETLNQEMAGKTIEFNPNSDVLTPAGKLLLDEFAATLKGAPGAVVEVDGHTDNAGNEANNVSLSGRRARAVEEYLISKGIARERMEAKGFGSSKPIADNATAEGRKKNRRIEFRVIHKKEG